MYDALAKTGLLQLDKGVALTPTPGSPFQAAPSHDTGHSNPGLFSSPLLNLGLHRSSGSGSTFQLSPSPGLRPRPWLLKRVWAVGIGHAA